MPYIGRTEVHYERSSAIPATPWNSGIIVSMCFQNPITGRSCGPCSMLFFASFYSFLICFFFYYYVDSSGADVSSGGAAFFARGPLSCPFPRCYPHLLRKVPRNETFQRHRQQMMVPISVPDHKPFELRCHTCALVTSSGQLLGRRAGKAIDAAECVIRMNDAPTRGFEADVGGRTTVRVVGHTNFRPTFQNKPSNQKTHFMHERTKSENIVIAWLYTTNVYKNPAYRLILNYSQLYKNVTFYMHTLAMMRYNNEVFHNETGITRTQAKTWLTTGWHTMLLALDMCDDLIVYGMVYGDYCMEHPNDSTPYHYYGNSGNRTRTECGYYMKSEERLTSGHLFVTEKYIFARWAKKYGIKFVYPSWKTDSADRSSLDSPFMRLYREKYGPVDLNRTKDRGTGVDGSGKVQPGPAGRNGREGGDISQRHEAGDDPEIPKDGADSREDADYAYLMVGGRKASRQGELITDHGR
ncbi:alpha-N-acetyl-neuraminyl-2,3-beta-galactosyl-1,3-N-acetyl-galactosaminide alpha-2,6-sialyltransferase-like [Acanthaster planci]|uniref:Alpha-N-acetyl-neuraminyl-2,3-beta-galactosyl-1, 3-N-acetyl-galactosaminide alpha-2,6-sialyltransferase-like n=1 Tax=Acanthaster planci TaxID=133434 RepID=A0A8B7Y569_ACAPL|nr:alpha-N-acetyl-neuraminyl-2,3-beta-galactosyl-1,3-N-acetyl-galactosaminide alpha-2,6-sialyltransferase-like [Acanthaster planci]XP_022087683.1 alpha-N-acetyl-neuraminyl-2,3-beta-galactosyl-1,3-N-acetyl-galactosaminide alpha-2,6-sialyltransferase-like [Acanthaster planci]XP_022087685.1 alpha-N-acetyl-neuraminyl-2,3-beta-galactosyl-1,3-N-acetyl-galactosaminide alpha-2,6-sialyltransferase-like [Acanthaster planci]XP_022087686.1 alpha-N-acetyl-neuraminyl-2,3-beta-galactosyl-1,3-N-acetyl-galactosa